MFKQKPKKIVILQGFERKGPVQVPKVGTSISSSTCSCYITVGNFNGTKCLI